MKEMKLTPYNLHEAIAMLQAHAFIYFMTELDGPLPRGEHGMALWDLVGHLDKKDAEEAIRAFEATQ